MYRYSTRTAAQSSQYIITTGTVNSLSDMSQRDSITPQFPVVITFKGCTQHVFTLALCVKALYVLLQLSLGAGKSQQRQQQGRETVTVGNHYLITQENRQKLEQADSCCTYLTCLHGVLGNRSRICLSPGGFDHTMSAPQMSLAMYAVGVILTKPSSGSSLVIQMWVKHHIPNTKRRHANRVLVLLPVHKLYPLPCCAFITTFSVANY